MREHLVKFIATGAWSGYFPLVPGSIGTIPAWLIAYYLLGHSQPALIAATAITLVLSIWSAGEAEVYFGHDARKIVIDEWLGMFLAVLFVPHSLANYGMAFLAFRIFDVIKLYPARKWEQLPGGWGVTMDDFAAGVQANIAVQLVLLVI